MTKQCELCEQQARMYCESDQASLCWECDARVHGANFLVARHSRSLLCRSCQAPTPWQASGSWLGPTVSVCEACLGGGGGSAGDVSEKGEMGGVGGRPADGGRDLQEEEEDDEGGEDEDDEDEGEEEDEDGENQVVPLSMQAGTTTTATAPSVASCSSSEESSSSRIILQKMGFIHFCFEIHTSYFFHNRNRKPRPKILPYFEASTDGGVPHQSDASSHGRATRGAPFHNPTAAAAPIRRRRRLLTPLEVEGCRNKEEAALPALAGPPGRPPPDVLPRGGLRTVDAVLPSYRRPPISGASLGTRILSVLRKH